MIVSLFWGLKMQVRHPLGVLIGGIRRNGTANVGLDHLFLRETLSNPNLYTLILFGTKLPVANYIR